MDVGEILDRLGLRIDGKLNRAAQMLYGTRFLPDHPQGQLKLGRFRGTNLVIEACLAHEIAPPEVSEQAVIVTVTFRAAVGAGSLGCAAWI